MDKLYKKLAKLLDEFRTDELRREMKVNGAEQEYIDVAYAEMFENEYEVDEYLEKWKNVKKFVKRLVDNDKIDHKLVAKYEKIFGISIISGKEYEIIIMLLAISDTPVEDLILYLK